MRLTWGEVREIKSFDHTARREGRPLNVCLTIRAPLDVADKIGKRAIAKTVGHFGQELQRRGQPHFGETVYEKAPHLHAHHLVHVDPENNDVVARYADGETVYEKAPHCEAVEQRRQLGAWIRLMAQAAQEVG
jgi:hypothetical protein